MHHAALRARGRPRPRLTLASALALVLSLASALFTERFCVGSAGARRLSAAWVRRWRLPPQIAAVRARITQSAGATG